jgi:hypothetical protein
LPLPRSEHEHPLARQAGETGFRSFSDGFEELFTFNCLLRDLLLLRGNLNPSPGATARFNSVDLSSVLLPPLKKSMSSLSPQASLTCPMPNEKCSIQSCGFQFLVGVCFSGAAFTASIKYDHLRTYRTVSPNKTAQGPNVRQTI